MSRAPDPPGSSVWSRARPWVLPAIVLLCVTLPAMHTGDWQRTDTGRYAAVGLDAWDRGEPWTLHAGDGIPYFNKPPLAIWIHGLVLRVAGPGAWSARLPSLFVAVGCVLATVSVVRRVADAESALWSGLVLALTYDFFRRVRSISLDLWVVLFMLLALIAIIVAVEHRGSRGRCAAWFAAAGIALGLGLLCKPLVALLAIPLFAAWLCWSGYRRLVPWLGLTLFGTLLTAAPWHVSMVLRHGAAFTEQYFGVQIASRAAGTLTAAPFDAKPVWYYAAHLAGAYWPWLIAVAASLAHWWRRGGLSAGGSAERWAILWFIGWFVALSLFPDRRDRYALPMFPALAVLAGLWIRPHAGAWLRGRVPEAIAAVVVMLAPILVFVPVGGGNQEPAAWRALYQWIDADPGERSPRALWQGGFALERRARLYLRYGTWPRSTRDERGVLLINPEVEPPPGAFLLYHRRDGWTPGDNETEVLRAEDLRVTRLGRGGWRPIRTPDPGPVESGGPN